MKTADEPPPLTMPGIFAEFAEKFEQITEGWVEVRVYKSNNALQNRDLTIHDRKRGRIAESAEIATRN